MFTQFCAMSFTRTSETYKPARTQRSFFFAPLNLKPVKYSMINYGLRCFAAGAFMVR